MKIFAGVRLGIWAIVLGACLVIVASYWTASSTVLNQTTLQNWAQKSDAYSTLRDDMIAPRLVSSIDTIKPDGFALLTDKDVISALDSSVTPDQLRQKATPAIAALRNWLDSKSPEISFSIPVSDIQARFIAAVSQKIDSEIAALPPCTANNSLADLQNSVCSYTPSLSAQIKSAFLDSLTTGGNKAIGTTLTQNDVTLPSSVTNLGKNLPDDLNLLYMAAIFCGGVLLFGILWLVFKKRGWGLITLGLAGLIGGAGEYLVGIIVHGSADKISLGNFQKIATTALDGIQSQATQHAIVLIVAGLVCLLLGIGLTIFLKQHTSKQLEFSHAE